MEAIRVEGLSRAFGDVEAVGGLTFSVAAGEIFGLVGPDGAGKTTVLRLLAGVLDPTAGEVRLLGRPLAGSADAAREETGYVSQRFGLYPDLTVLENIRFFADLYSVPRRVRRERIDRLFAFSGLGPFADRLAGALSGGMKQKLALSCALVHRPRLLLLDEPTAGVDPVSRRDFWGILRRLPEDGVTVVVATSYLDEAEHCGRLLLLHRGRALAVGAPGEIRGLFRGALLEVPTAEPRRAAAALRAAFPDSSVSLFGDRVHLATAGDAASAEAAGAALARAGVPFDPPRPIPPTLEDVFVSVAGDGSVPR